MTSECPVCLSPVKPGDAVCPTCNFHLAGATQEFRPLGDAHADEAPDRLAHARLRMVRGSHIGAVYNLTSDVTKIGRNPQSDIFLNDMTVSRSHANVTRQSDALVINDEQSFNGVWVNNQTVLHHVLRQGDYIQIGKYDFIYEEDPEGGNDGR